MKLYPSLSGLMIIVRNDPDGFQDGPDSIYFFGSTKLGLEETFERYAEDWTEEQKTKFREILHDAEQDDRVSWRGTCIDSSGKVVGRSAGDSSRIDWLCEKFSRIFVNPAKEVPEYEKEVASRNYPALRDFMAQHFPKVEFVGHN